MKRPLRSLMKTFLLAVCALTLSLTGFDLMAQAEDKNEVCTVQPAHASLQQKRRRTRRRARVARRPTKRPVREFVDTQMPEQPVVGAVKGRVDYVPPGTVYGSPNTDVTSADSVPPPPTKPAPSTRRSNAPIRGGVLNGKAISLPKPPYPAVAKAARASGTVVVEVIVNEAGDVISARAVSGHPLLQQASVQAAYGARFSPTQLSGQPVKVMGTISYNFAQ